jgi:hypothetical protein
MKALRPPILATKLLERLISGPHGDALAGDLMEQYRQGRSSAWYWRQALIAIVVSLIKDRTRGGLAILSWLLLLSLMVVGAVRHPASIEGAGLRLLIMDVLLLLGYGAFSVWVWRQRRVQTREALSAGGQAGLIVGAVFIANHALESFVQGGNRAADLVRGAGSTLLMLALFGAAGSAAWERTRSALWAVIAGLWSASVALPIALGFAFTSNQLFEEHAASRLYQPFMASGMNDPGAFVVRNSLLAASEALARLPFAALALSFMGCISNAWISARSRGLTVVAAWLAPLIFVAGASALWYADSLERGARPPFILTGLLAAGIALCGAHPVWSSLTRHRRTAR